MRRVVSLANYIKSYNITREQIMEVIDSDREFFDGYINWGKNDNDTVLGHKAIERLGEFFNDKENSVSANTQPVTQVTEQSLSKPKRQRKDVFAEDPIAPKKQAQAPVQKDINEPQTIDAGKYMDRPVIKKGTKTVTEGKRRRKTKYTLTKQFVNEHGFISVSDNIKQLRQMLMSDGTHKAEDVAIMLDDEIKAEFAKSYYVINAEEGLYLIKRSTLNSILGDVLFVEKE